MNARQFFDAWEIVVNAVNGARRNPNGEAKERSIMWMALFCLHGDSVAQKGIAMFDRLRSDARTGNMKH